MKKKKSKKIKMTRITFVLLLVLYVVVGGVAWAAIRMTDDPKPKRISYQLKDVNTGIISTKYQSDDQDFNYKIGDFFEEASTNYPNGAPQFNILHKWVVIDIKHVK